MKAGVRRGGPGLPLGLEEVADEHQGPEQDPGPRTRRHVPARRSGPVPAQRSGSRARMARRPRTRDHAMNVKDRHASKRQLGGGERGPPQHRRRRAGAESDVRRRTGTIRRGLTGTGGCAPASAYNGRTVKDTFYLTSAIYYVNDVPHVGHTYEIVACDVIARYHRARGRAGLLPHRLRRAQHERRQGGGERGLSPQEWTDQIVPKWQEVFAQLGISYDDWIRTSEPRHVERVQKFVQLAPRARATSYLGTLRGSLLRLLRGVQAGVRARGRPVPHPQDPRRSASRRRTTSSGSRATRTRLLRLYDEHPASSEPEVRRNEVVSFVRSGLKDLSISRPAAAWGVPVPWDQKHVIYVWVDALLNYITAPGFGADAAAVRVQVWPADVHMIGKDITRFHAVIWPAMLMSAGLQLPRTVFAHGWLSFGGREDVEVPGHGASPRPRSWSASRPDAYRWYLMREVPFGQDGNFTWDSMAARYTSELANGHREPGQSGPGHGRLLLRGPGARALRPEAGTGPWPTAAAGLARRFDRRLRGARAERGVRGPRPSSSGRPTATWSRSRLGSWPRTPDGDRNWPTRCTPLWRRFGSSRVLGAPVMPAAAESLWDTAGDRRSALGRAPPGCRPLGRSGAGDGHEPGEPCSRGSSRNPRPVGARRSPGASPRGVPPSRGPRPSARPAEAVDTHCHLFLMDAGPGRGRRRGKAAGVGSPGLRGDRSGSSRRSLEMAAVVPGGVRHGRASIPHTASRLRPRTPARSIEELLADPLVVAWGRRVWTTTGGSRRTRISSGRSVPTSPCPANRTSRSWSTSATHGTTPCGSWRRSGPNGSCSTASPAAPRPPREAERRGYFVSFAGNLTYPNAEGFAPPPRPLDPGALVVETDSPFLPPQTLGGRTTSRQRAWPSCAPWPSFGVNLEAGRGRHRDAARSRLPAPPLGEPGFSVPRSNTAFFGRTCTSS